MFTGCNPVDGSSAAQNGLDIDADGEMYTLMSIDTIINGKVAPVLTFIFPLYMNIQMSYD